MYDYIKGKIAYIDESSAVIETGGIGYKIFAVTDTLYKLSSAKGEVCLFTYFQVKEDEMSLYGFTSKEDREVFLKLITVNGIGAKTALSILSGVTFKDFAAIVAAGDAAALSRVKGVGKKTAERIILELVGKLSASGTVAELKTDAQADAIFALMSLGLSETEAEKRVHALKGRANTAEEYISLALRGVK